VFGWAEILLGYAGCWAKSCCVWLCDTVASLFKLMGHVMLCFALRYMRSFRQVAWPRHIVFYCAVLELRFGGCWATSRCVWQCGTRA
jgi:hypothetical protein